MKTELNEKINKDAWQETLKKCPAVLEIKGSKERLCGEKVVQQQAAYWHKNVLYRAYRCKNKHEIVVREG